MTKKNNQTSILNICQKLNLTFLDKTDFFHEFLNTNYANNLYKIIYTDLENNQILLKDNYTNEIITIIKTTKNDKDIFIIIHENKVNNAKAIYQFFEKDNNEIDYLEIEVYNNNKYVLIKKSLINIKDNKLIYQKQENIKGQYQQDNNNIKVLSRKKNKYLNFNMPIFYC